MVSDGCYRPFKLLKINTLVLDKKLITIKIYLKVNKISHIRSGLFYWINQYKITIRILIE